MAFYVGGQEQEITDESQGDSRETQAEIERMLGMSHDLFKHIVALNTYTEPFLALKANDQRAIIEQLLGITMLSEKADALKEQLKATRDAITQEEYRIKAVTDANSRIQEQIEATRRRQTLWNTKRLSDIAELERALAVVDDLDIEQELVNHDALDTYNEKTKKAAEINRWKIACETEQVKILKQLDKLKREIEA
jgi:DNA repair exonuclease SbcCD ATPase subunit